MQLLYAIMRSLLYITFLLFFSSCSFKKDKDICSSNILHIGIKDFTEQPNKILNYFDTTSFKTISDSTSMQRFERADRIGYFLKPLATDSTKPEFTYNVKEGIIKTPKYVLDLSWILVNSEHDKNVYSWLTTYDKNRNQISHLDFAHWSKEKNRFASGKIDCDTTIHLIISDKNEHRLFKINEKGDINFAESNKIDIQK